jgi:hypothetical protein
MYLELLKDNTGYLHKYLWKMKVLLKLRYLYGLFIVMRFLQKDNLVKRNWQGNSKYCLGKQFNICSLRIPLQKLFRQLFIWFLTLHPL